MGCQSGAARVQGEILNHWPRELYNAGCFNPASKLDGTNRPSAHAKGEAIDLGVHPPYRGRGSVGQQVFLWLHANRARLGIVQLIWDGQIWSASNRPGEIRPYPDNPHRDHIHCQFTPEAARNPRLTALPFDQQEEDAMTPAQEEKLDRLLAYHENLSLDGALGTISRKQDDGLKLLRGIDAFMRNLSLDGALKTISVGIDRLKAKAGIR